MEEELELKGEVIRPGERGYDETRTVWNAMIDRRPKIVARCRDTEDVCAAVHYAARSGLSIAVRGGGHNVAGLGTCEGGLLLDLSLVTAVNVDAERRIARVGGGARWRDVDRETQKFGLATPSGIISSTGVGGLTLGGGIGWLARCHGLTSDNLIEAEIVTADGVVRRANASENADLFWGIRGGGGNFGAVISFTFALHDVGPDVLFGPTVYAYDDAKRVLRGYRDFARDAPRECCVWLDLLVAPPLPFLAQEVHGTPVVSVLQFYAGDLQRAEQVLAPLRKLASPLGDAVARRPYVQAQSLFDEAYAAGKRNYWSTHNLRDLSEAAVDAIVEAGSDLPTPLSDIMIHQLGGAIDAPGPDATAYPHRGAAFAITPGARWDAPAEDPRCIAWTRGVHAALRPHATGTAYSNFIGDATGSEGAAYAAHLERLRELKRRYDPRNLFRSNQNVAP